MKDTTAGMLEALGWALTVTTGEGKKEIQAAINDILRAASTDFLFRAKANA